MMKEAFLERLTAEAKDRFADNMYSMVVYIYILCLAIKGRDQIYDAILNLSCNYRLIKDMKFSIKKAVEIKYLLKYYRCGHEEVHPEPIAKDAESTCNKIHCTFFPPCQSGYHRPTRKEIIS